MAATMLVMGGSRRSIEGHCTLHGTAVLLFGKHFSKHFSPLITDFNLLGMLHSTSMFSERR